jgi:UDP-N-acetylglucosamine:LPS N-acetylglucosamine transferase
MKKSKDKKVCIVSSSGGHLYKTYCLQDWWKKYPRFWVVRNDKFTSDILSEENKYYAFFPENRNIINSIKNLFLAFKILNIEKPTLVFSMGAGIAPPFFIAARILNIKSVFIETFSYIPKATLSGKIIYFICNHFYVQNKKLLKIYPRAKYIGSILPI